MSDNVSDAFSGAYAEVLRLARARLAREQAAISAHTLTHELYLQLQQRDDLRFDSRAAFLAYASQAMRSLLVDLARERLAAKRHADLVPLTMSAEVVPAGGGTPEQILQLNQTLQRLGQIDERLMRVAEMRAVLGLEVAEIAQVLGVSEPTVKRDWQRARAFLHEALGLQP